MSDYFIRINAYKVLGYTKEALNDKNHNIRMEAYKQLGWTEKALIDENFTIRQKAKKVFKIFFDIIFVPCYTNFIIN